MSAVDMTRAEFLGGLFASSVVAGGCMTSGAGASKDEVLRIAHCGDPQFGMSWPRTPEKKRTEEGYRKDLLRL